MTENLSVAFWGLAIVGAAIVILGAVIFLALLVNERRKAAIAGRLQGKAAQIEMLDMIGIRGITLTTTTEGTGTAKIERMFTRAG